MSDDWWVAFWGHGDVVAWWIMFHTFKALLSRSGLGNYSPPARFNCLSEQGVGCLEGRIGLPALQPVPCVSGSCMGGEGHGRLVYQIYLVYRELCHLVQYTCPFVLPLLSACGCQFWAFCFLLLTASQVYTSFLADVDMRHVKRICLLKYVDDCWLIAGAVQCLIHQWELFSFLRRSKDCDRLVEVILQVSMEVSVSGNADQHRSGEGLPNKPKINRFREVAECLLATAFSASKVVATIL